MTHDEMIAVIQSHKDGKEIEFKPNGFSHWSTVKTPDWAFSHGEYRVKPPQIEAWGVVSGGELYRVCHHKNVAEEWAGPTGTVIRLIPDQNYTGE